MSGEKYCLQCGAILLLNAVPADPLYPQGPQVPACSACRSRAFDVPGNKIQELTAQRDELLAALKDSNAFDKWWFDDANQTPMSKRPGGYDFSRKIWEAAINSALRKIDHA